MYKLMHMLCQKHIYVLGRGHQHCESTEKLLTKVHCQLTSEALKRLQLCFLYATFSMIDLKYRRTEMQGSATVVEFKKVASTAVVRGGSSGGK